MKNEKRIKFVSANPGSGKTHALILRILRFCALNKQIILAVPTVDLMNEISKRLEKFAAKQKCKLSTVLVQSESGNSVIEQIERSLNHHYDVTLITHIALQKLSILTLQKLSNYHLIIDEVFDIGECELLKLQKFVSNKGIFSTMLKSTAYMQDDIFQLTIKDADAARDYLRRKNVDSLDSIKIEETKTLIKNIADCAKLVLYKEFPKSKNRNFCIAVLWNPNNLKYFKSVLIVSAFFEYTALYYHIKNVFKLSNCTESFNLLNLSSRYKQLNLYPMFKKNVMLRTYSKNFRDNSRVCKVEHYDAVKRYYINNNEFDINRSMQLQNYANLIIDADCNFGSDTARIANKEEASVINIGCLIASHSHGQNCHIDKISAACVAAFNRKPFVRAFFEKLFVGYNSWIDSNILVLVQALCRIAVRDYQSNARTHVLVTDYKTAKMIQSLLEFPRLKRHCLIDDYTVFTRDIVRKGIELPEDYDPKTHYKNGRKRKKNELPEDYDPETHFRNGRLRKKNELPEDYDPETHFKNGKLKKRNELPEDYDPETHFKSGKRKQTLEERREKQRLLKRIQRQR